MIPLLKLFIVTLLFYFFAIMQNSFLPYFKVMESVPNFIFVLFFILIFFENLPVRTNKNDRNEGLFFAILAGFFLDIISPFYFGMSIASLLVVYFFEKLVAYFLKEIQNKYLIFYFILIFSACFVLYNILLYLLSIFLYMQFNFNFLVFIALAYNLIFASIGFYAYKNIYSQNGTDSQLKLL